MKIKERTAGELEILKDKANKEADAKQRDRYRSVIFAIEGLKAEEIMAKVGRSKTFVQIWCYRYRDGGIDALIPISQPGRPTKLSAHQEPQFIKRITAGPIEKDGVCTFHGKDIVRILEKEFGVEYSLFGVYDLLHRLGFSSLKPRPKHRKNDPEKMDQWLKDAPFFFTGCRKRTRRSN